MKRFLRLTLVLVILAALVSCGQKAEATWQEQYDLGMRYLDEGNYEEAVVAFTAAIDIDEKRPEAYIGRGDAYFASDEYSTAEEDYRSALALDTSMAEIYDRLADLYVQTGDLEQALEILRQGYEATKEQGLLDRLQALEELDELPELPEHLPDAAIVVSMYSAEYGLEGHDAYQFDEQGRMTSNTWYDLSNEAVVPEVWAYDDDQNTTTGTRGERDENGQWVETQETYEGTESKGWYWYSMGAEDEEYITDPTLETENGRLELENGEARYGFDAQGRAITIHTYNGAGELVGYCVVTYTR